MKVYSFRAEYEDGTFEMVKVIADNVYAAMNEAYTTPDEEPANLSWLGTVDLETQRPLAF